MDISEGTAADLEGYLHFRQAIANGDADAWITLADRYRRQMVAWANHCCARLAIPAPPEDIAEQALARARAALVAVRLEFLPGLAAFLAFLRSCVIAAALDHGREQSARMHSQLAAPVEAPAVPSQQAELWQLIMSTARSEQERLLARTSLIDALPPRAIYARYPDQFADVAAIYRMKCDLFKRLQHNQAIERFCYEEALAHGQDT
jgi:DNA-directed RNA polymerase specialized sigma24 family protein